MCVYICSNMGKYYVMLNFKRRIQKLHIDYKYKYNLVKIFRGKNIVMENIKISVVRLWVIS